MCYMYKSGHWSVNILVCTAGVRNSLYIDTRPQKLKDKILRIKDLLKEKGASRKGDSLILKLLTN